MKLFTGTLFAFLAGSYAWAQQPGSAPPSSTMMTPAMLASSTELTALVDTMKADIKDQPGVARALLSSPSHRVILEYRVGPNTPGVHEDNAELMFFVGGAATLVTGGKMVGTNPGTIEGGASRRVATGDVVLIPEGTPHWLQAIDGSATFFIAFLPRPPVKQ